MKRFILLFLLVLGMNSCLASQELSRQAVAFYSDNNFNKTLDLLLQINEKERTPQDWLLLGNLLDEKGKKSEAIFMYEKAINANPKYYKPYYNLANIYLEQGKYNTAIKYYKKAAKLNPENAFVFYNMGCAYLKTGDAKNAKTAFIKAVTLRSDLPDIHYNLAYVYKKLNKPKLAETYLNNYKKLTGN